MCYALRMRMAFVGEGDGGLFSTQPVCLLADVEHRVVHLLTDLEKTKTSGRVAITKMDLHVGEAIQWWFVCF